MQNYYASGSRNGSSKNRNGYPGSRPSPKQQYPAGRQQRSLFEEDRKQPENLFDLDKPQDLFDQPENLFDDQSTRPAAAYGRTQAKPAHDATRVSAGSAKSVQQARAARPSSSVQQATRASSPVAARGGGSGNGGGGGRKKGGGKKGGDSTAKYVFRNIMRAFLVLFCIGIIAASFFAVSAVQYVVEATEDDDEILNLENLQLSQTSYLMALNPNNPNALEENDWIEYQKLVGGESDSTWVPLSEIPQTMIDAVLSTEDREFYNHKGVSISRTIFAAFNQIFKVKDRFGGASTLDQQLVKNLTGENEVSDTEGDMTVGYKRKAREIYRAYTMNKNYSKDMILEAYLNTLPLSGTIVGVKAAAREYFNKELKDLTVAECAMIAGITQAPGKYNPFVNPENTLTRRNDVLYFMFVNEKISEADMLAESEKPLGLEKPTNTYKEAGEVNSYFSDTVLESVVADLMEANNYSRSRALHDYYNKGLRIYTTVDLRLQEEMETQYEKGYGNQSDGFIFPEITQVAETKDAEGNVIDSKEVLTQSAMVVIDYDGQLKGVVGGIGEKQESLGFNRATQSVRQVGSTMKPIAAYPLGIDYGWINYSMMVPDTYVQTKDGSSGTPNWPSNFSGAPSGNNMSVEYAVAQSINTVAARVGLWVGQEEMFDFLVETLQITSLVSPDEDPARNDMNLSSLVLGGMTQGISPYELAGAYQMFGNKGLFTSLHCYTRIEDANGNLVLKPKVTTVQAISEDAAYVMNRLLSRVVNSGGTANGMALNYMDSIGKTGTTTAGGHDNDRWFVGLTPYYVSAVWWGYDGNQEIQWPARASTNPPPLMWKTVMETVQADLPEKSFPEKPEGVIQSAFCRDTGMLAGPNCPNTGTGYYIREGRVPGECPHQIAPPEEGGEAA